MYSFKLLRSVIFNLESLKLWYDSDKSVHLYNQDGIISSSDLGYPDDVTILNEDKFQDAISDIYTELFNKYKIKLIYMKSKHKLSKFIEDLKSVYSICETYLKVKTFNFKAIESSGYIIDNEINMDKVLQDLKNKIVLKSMKLLIESTTDFNDNIIRTAVLAATNITIPEVVE